ncbi:MAG TPA: GGDEF domain-containing protein [Paraburkholderia sp.]|jgi:diguanylate cyclase (GGDEF)-like protein|uniref:GGDEF domain-containing protein n=1 Tax=Paraburkholderia sp. TaxID=1926495 RepID=UPI002DE2D08D|nr:GGDEF domain-containing protein [Paraburkholderia sp.]
MHVDLLTLYFLAIGTLLASAAMTLWEHRTHPGRSKELKTLAAGYTTLAIGCAAVIWRRELPGVWGSALSNMVMLCGYLLIAHGVATMNGRRYRLASALILLVQALAWVISGTRWLEIMWMYLTAIPISLTAAMAARELLRGEGRKWGHARNIAVLVTGAHAALYAFRAAVLPWLATRYGESILPMVSKITMYEGVLYSVVLPMTLLRLVREETHSQLLQESQTDYLTRLGNRRWFFEEGARMLGHAGRHEPVALLAFDLDHFKAINDRYGHKTGDEVLKSFSAIARGAVGPQALLARIGGEEFAALLPGMESAPAQAMGELIVRRFEQTAALGIDGVGIGMRTTVSIGLASKDGDTATLADLLAAADKALYRAKSLGGNRLERADSGAQTTDA